MFALGRLWRFWIESWREARRARWLYIVLALGFVVLAAVGAAAGDAAVAALAGIAAVVTFVIALAAPKIASWLNPPKDAG